MGGSIIRSTNMSSLRDYKLMDFDENNANFQNSDRSDMFVVRAQGSMFKPQRGDITLVFVLLRSMSEQYQYLISNGPELSCLRLNESIDSLSGDVQPKSMVEYTRGEKLTAGSSPSRRFTAGISLSDWLACETSDFDRGYELKK